MFLVPRRFLHGCAALLALVLSAIGGTRAGIERLAGQDRAEEQAVVRSATVARTMVVAEVVLQRCEPAVATLVAPAGPARAVSAAASVRMCVLLLGSAGGPRAP